MSLVFFFQNKFYEDSQINAESNYNNTNLGIIQRNE